MQMGNIGLRGDVLRGYMYSTVPNRSSVRATLPDVTPVISHYARSSDPAISIGTAALSTVFCVASRQVSE